MKKLFKGIMGLASFAVVIAGAYYLTKKLLGEVDEDLDEEYDEDLDFEDDEETDAKSREYVTLDFEEDGEESTQDDAPSDDAENAQAEETQASAE